MSISAAPVEPFVAPSRARPPTPAGQESRTTAPASPPTVAQAWRQEAERLVAQPIVGESGDNVWAGCGIDNIAFDAACKAAVCLSDDGLGIVLVKSVNLTSMSYRVIDCSDVLACLVVGGGSETHGVTASQTRTTTRSAPTLGGALLGALFDDPTLPLAYQRSVSHGESVGSIQAVTKNVEGNTVRITINDPKDRYFSLEFKSSSSAAQLCNAIAVVARRGEKRSRELEAVGTVSSVSVPDAIMKLATLKEQGYLTHAPIWST